MALLDGDRLRAFRDGVHSIDASDLMRRMVKEDLLSLTVVRCFRSVRLHRRIRAGR